MSNQTEKNSTDDNKAAPAAFTPDVLEKGAPKNGVRQVLDARLFFQLQVFSGGRDNAPLIKALQDNGIEGVLYEDIHDPSGVGLLTFNADPDFFIGRLRPLLIHEPFAQLTIKPEFSMLGRTYSLGYEQDLEDWLLHKPRRTALNPAWPWAVWYPLRRSGAFTELPHPEQMEVLKEHGMIGRAFGQADLSHDIRLACFGMDPNDNDFVIGLTGKKLYPLSATVQAMRKTKQTANYIEKMGPFFIGKAAWQSPAS
ncbi:MAG: chlorite dismutase family protein [Elusimicrobia bacterium]|nr:chlorite dismutase family protein [Elusimicrobiota bacterium]